MARVYKQADMASGDIVTPIEMNEEFRAIIGEFNGHLDRDNIAPALITDIDKVRLDTFNQVFFIETDTLVNETRNETTDGQQWFDVDSLETTMTTGDGAVEIEAQLAVEHTGGLTIGTVDMGIFVDGLLIARTDIDRPEFQFDSLCLTAKTPVGAGPHDIRVKMRINPTFITTSTFPSVGVDQLGRCLWAREVKR